MGEKIGAKRVRILCSLDGCNVEKLVRLAHVSVSQALTKEL